MNDGKGKYSDNNKGMVKGVPDVPGLNPDGILEIDLYEKTPEGIMMKMDNAAEKLSFAHGINITMRMLGVDDVETYRSMLLRESQKAHDDIRDGKISQERGFRKIARLKEEISYLGNIKSVSEWEIRKREILEYLFEKKEELLPGEIKPFVWRDVL